MTNTELSSEKKRKQRELLAKHGVDKIKFYSRSSSLAEVYTTCIFINTEKGRIEARGVSICSLKDTFKRIDGKNRAFGRAISALKRKTNNERINSLGREYEFVQRKFKIRNEDEDENFIATVIEELTDFDPFIDVSIINGNDKYKRYYIVNVPANYPIAKAHEHYKYKSEYRPNPACKEELTLLKEV